jgi:hypothetical protein
MPEQYARTAQWPPETREPQPYPGPDEPFPQPAGWYRQPGQPTEVQGWFREPGEQDGGELYAPASGRPPATGRRPGGKRLVLAVTGVTVIVAGILVGVLLSRNTSGHSAAAPRPSQSVSPSSTSPATASGQATAINSVLRASSAARKSLPGAVNEVLQCSNVAGGTSQIQNVVNQRSSELSQAEALSASALPNGTTVKSDLVAALHASLTSDQDYLSWARQQSSGCKRGRQTSAYQTALGADSQSATAKRTFAQAWNPIARTNGLPLQSATSF